MTDSYEKNRAFMEAAKKGQKRKVLSLLKEGANIEYKAHFAGPDTTALMVAAQAGNVEMIDLLIGQGAQVDAVSKYDFTALYYAAFKNQTAAMERLLQHKANVNHYADEMGYTPLSYAVVRGVFALDAIKLLLRHGANPHLDKRGEDAWTLAHHKFSQGFTEYQKIIDAIRPYTEQKELDELANAQSDSNLNTL